MECGCFLCGLRTGVSDSLVQSLMDLSYDTFCFLLGSVGEGVVQGVE